MPAHIMVITGPSIHRTVRRADLLAAGAGDSVAIETVLHTGELAAGVTHCTAIAHGGGYRASIPLDAIVRGGELVIAKDGLPLDEANGGPFRLIVNEGDTLCWNVKNVAELRLSDGPLPDNVPAQPTH